MENTLLNMIPSSYIPEVHLSQYDVGRSIPFKLMDGNSEYSVPSGANIKILATKPSGLGFEVACTFSGNIVTLVNTETMSNESGRFRAELRITSGNVILGTSNFIMNVERSPHPEGTIDGDAETLLPELTLLVERIENSNARIESMTASATPLPSGQNPTANYNETTNTLELGIPVADRQYITVDGVNYPITSINSTVVDEVSGLLVAYSTDSTVFIPDGVGVKNVAQFLQAQINGKVSAVKLNGDILTPHYDSAFGDGVVDLGTISDDTKADAIVKSASGSIASFSDGGDNLPMKSLKVNIVPKQSGSGDPSPSNVRPISGWDAVDTNVTGVNIWDEEWESGIYNPNSGDKTGSSSYIRSKNYIPVRPSATYCLVKPTGKASRVHFYDFNKRWISSPDVIYTGQPYTAFDTPANAYYMTFNVAGTTYNNDISINYPSTDHEYHPYNGQTITTNLGQTVYGGVLDVVSGKLTITKAFRNLGTDQSGSWYMASTGVSGKQRLAVGISGIKTPNSAVICNIFKTVSGNDIYNGVEGIGTDSNDRLLFYKSDLQTVADWKSWATTNNLTICYELATPIELTLTPTEVKSLLGSNNVWSESGTVEVEYRADTTLAYNELLNLIANM